MVDIKDNSEAVKRDIAKAISNGLEAIGMTAETYAKEDCPVDTGRLRNSITHEVSDKEQAVYIGTNVEYAPYVELGTSKQAPRPFLKPAATQHSGEYKRIMKDAMGG